MKSFFVTFWNCCFNSLDKLEYFSSRANFYFSISLKSISCPKSLEPLTFPEKHLKILHLHFDLLHLHYIASGPSHYSRAPSRSLSSCFCTSSFSSSLLMTVSKSTSSESFPCRFFAQPCRMLLASWG